MWQSSTNSTPPWTKPSLTAVGPGSSRVHSPSWLPGSCLALGLLTGRSIRSCRCPRGLWPELIGDLGLTEQAAKHARMPDTFRNQHDVRTSQRHATSEHEDAHTRETGFIVGDPVDCHRERESHGH